MQFVWEIWPKLILICDLFQFPLLVEMASIENQQNFLCRKLGSWPLLVLALFNSPQFNFPLCFAVVDDLSPAEILVSDSLASGMTSRTIDSDSSPGRLHKSREMLKVQVDQRVIWFSCRRFELAKRQSTYCETQETFCSCRSCESVWRYLSNLSTDTNRSDHSSVDCATRMHTLSVSRTFVIKVFDLQTIAHATMMLPSGLSVKDSISSSAAINQFKSLPKKLSSAIQQLNCRLKVSDTQDKGFLSQR